jgi:adenylyltransferase/sulfurtransferase
MTYAILPHTPAGDAPWERQADGSSGATPCLRCIFEQAPPPGMNPTCDTAGVLGPVVSIIANYQVAETLKILTGHYASVRPTLLTIDVWENTVRQLKVARAYDVGECVCCKKRQFEFLDGRFASATSTLCGRNAVQIARKLGGQKLDFDQIAARLRLHGEVAANKFMIRAAITDSGNGYELTVFPDGRAIVKGTKDTSVAKGIYAKYPPRWTAGRQGFPGVPTSGTKPPPRRSVPWRRATRHRSRGRARLPSPVRAPSSGCATPIASGCRARRFRGPNG